MTLSLKIADASFSKTVAGLMLLDKYPGAAIAYSLRRVKGDYADAACRVRNSSTGAEADIALAGAHLDEAALLAHTGVNDGFMTRLYDQSGNAVNALQPTQASQPKIVSAGALVEANGLPAVQADGVDDLMSFTVQTLQSGFLVARLDALTGAYHNAVGGESQGVILGGTTSSGIQLFQSPIFIDSGVEDTTTVHLVSFVSDGTTMSLYVDGVLAASGAIASLVLSTLFGQPAPTYAPITIQEFVGYTTNQAGNRAAIEADIKAYWGTP